MAAMSCMVWMETCSRGRFWSFSQTHFLSCIPARSVEKLHDQSLACCQVMEQALARWKASCAFSFSTVREILNIKSKSRCDFQVVI
jgi:hypothetical protein